MAFVETRAVPAGIAGQFSGRAAAKSHAVKLRLRRVRCAGKDDVRFIHAADLAQLDGAGRHNPIQAAVPLAPLDLPIAAAFARPNETFAVRQPFRNVVTQVHPRRITLGHEWRSRAVGWVRFEQDDFFLVAGLNGNRQGAISFPSHPR